MTGKPTRKIEEYKCYVICSKEQQRTEKDGDVEEGCHKPAVQQRTEKDGDIEEGSHKPALQQRTREGWRCRGRMSQTCCTTED